MPSPMSCGAGVLLGSRSPTLVSTACSVPDLFMLFLSFCTVDMQLVYSVVVISVTMMILGCRHPPKYGNWT